MSTARFRFDLALVLVLLILGVAGYPWGQRQYYLWLLHSPNPEQALDAQKGLERLGPAAVPALVDLVRTDSSSAARLLAFEALTKSNDARVLPLALDVGGADWDQELQSLALQLLGQAGIQEAQPIFRAMLTDPDPLLRYDALNGALAVGDASLVPHLIKALNDPEFVVAATAAMALDNLAGRNLPFPRGDSAESRRGRADTIAAWQEWYLTEFGDTSVGQAAPNSSAAYTGPAVPIPRPRATDFTLETPNGDQLRLSDLRGRPVLLNFWSTWCTPCIRETADLVAAARALGDDAVIIGISGEYLQDVPAKRELERLGEAATPDAIKRVQLDAVRRFMDQHGVTYPVVLGDQDTLDAYNAYALPTTVIIDRDGVIHRRLIKDRKSDFFIAALRAAAGETS